MDAAIDMPFASRTGVGPRKHLRWPSIDVHGKFYGDRPRGSWGTPPSGNLNARGIAK